MNHYHRRLDGQIVNLNIGATVKIPVDFAPPRSWFYKLAKKWGRRIPGFRISTRLPRGAEWMVVERIK